MSARKKKTRKKLFIEQFFEPEDMLNKVKKKLYADVSSKNKNKPKTKKMRVTGVKCPLCEEKIWSRHRHDYRFCRCGYSSVDGGRDYLKMGWGLKILDIEYTELVGKAYHAFNQVVGIPERVTLVVERSPETEYEPSWPY